MANDDLFDLPSGSAAAARIDRINGSALAAQLEAIERTAPRPQPVAKRRSNKTNRSNKSDKSEKPERKARSGRSRGPKKGRPSKAPAETRTPRLEPERESGPAAHAAATADAVAAEKPFSAAEAQQQPEPQHQLAPHQSKREPGPSSGGGTDLDPPAEAGAMPRLTGFDIRNKDFGRSWFGRGYRRADVDEYLTSIATTLDEIDADEMDRAHKPDVDPVSVIQDALAQDDNMGSSYLVLQQARRVAQVTVDDARAKADDLIATAEASAKDLHLKTRAARDATLDEAREDADQILASARDEARRIEAEARERDELASRREAEVELRAAHTERLLQERADALRTEAERITGLVTELNADQGAVDIDDSEVVPLHRQVE